MFIMMRARSNKAVLEAESESGNKLIAILNTQILDWDNKASHPWLAVMTTKLTVRK